MKNGDTGPKGEDADNTRIEELENLIESELSSKEATGESITVNDGANYDAQLTIESGQTSQEIGENSPSIEHPSEIKNVKGNCNIKVQNKNYWSISPRIVANTTDLIIDNNNNGTYTLNGTLDKANTEFRVGNYYASLTKILTLEKGSYKMQAFIDNTLVNTQITITNGTTYRQKTNTTDIDIEENEGISSIRFYIPNGTYTNSILKFSIVDMENDVSYVAHQEQNYNLNLPELNKIDDVKDYFDIEAEKEDGKVKIKELRLVRNTYTEILDNINNFKSVGTSASNIFRYSYNLSKNYKDSATNQTISYCNISKLVSSGQTYARIKGYTIASNIIYIYDEGESLADFKEKIKNIEIEVACQLQEPEIETITDETLISQLENLLNIKTYEGTTHIDCISEENNLLPILKLNYKESNKILLENKVDKEEGKGLSSNDFTDAEKSKLATLSNNYNNLENKPTNVSSFTNDRQYQTLTEVETLINEKITNVIEGDY